MSIINVIKSQTLKFTPHLGYFIEPVHPLQAARVFREKTAESDQSHKNAALHFARDVFKNKQTMCVKLGRETRDVIDCAPGSQNEERIVEHRRQLHIS